MKETYAIPAPPPSLSSPGPSARGGEGGWGATVPLTGGEYEKKYEIEYDIDRRE